MGLEVAAFNSVVSACGRALAWQEALGALLAMVSVEPDGATAIAAVRACRGRWSLGLVLLSSWPEALAARVAAMGACGEAAQWQHAVSLLEPAPAAYGAAMAACSRAQLWQRVLQLLQTSRDHAAHDSISCYTAMVACDRAREWQRALRLFHGFGGLTVEQDVRFFTSAISACHYGSRWRDAVA